MNSKQVRSQIGLKQLAAEFENAFRQGATTFREMISTRCSSLPRRFTNAEGYDLYEFKCRKLWSLCGGDYYYPLGFKLDRHYYCSIRSDVCGDWWRHDPAFVGRFPVKQITFL
jgi:hypothetical protein